MFNDVCSFLLPILCISTVANLLCCVVESPAMVHSRRASYCLSSLALLFIASLNLCLIFRFREDRFELTLSTAHWPSDESEVTKIIIFLK